MRVDDHIFVSVGYMNQVYHLAEPIVWKGKDSRTLDGIRRLEAVAVRSYPFHYTMRRMQVLYPHLRPCERCIKIQRIRDAR